VIHPFWRATAFSAALVYQEPQLRNAFHVTATRLNASAPKCRHFVDGVAWHPTTLAAEWCTLI